MKKLLLVLIAGFMLAPGISEARRYPGMCVMSSSGYGPRNLGQWCITTWEGAALYNSWYPCSGDSCVHMGSTVIGSGGTADDACLFNEAWACQSGGK